MLQLAPQPTLRLIISFFHYPFIIALFLGHYFLSSGLLAFWSDLDVKFKLRGVWFLTCSEIYLFTAFTSHGSTKRHSSESPGIDFSLCSCNCRPFQRLKSISLSSQVTPFLACYSFGMRSQKNQVIISGINRVKSLLFSMVEVFLCLTKNQSFYWSLKITTLGERKFKFPEKGSSYYSEEIIPTYTHRFQIHLF